jgi:deaminated glutathione amidase
MSSIPVAVIQLDTQDHIDENRTKAISLVDKASSQGAQLIVLPEAIVCLGSLDKRQAAAEPLAGPTATMLREAAKRNNIYLVGGSFLEKQEGQDKVYNTCLFIGPDGNVISVYRKIHLFKIDVPGDVVFDESQVVASGEKIVTADSPFGILVFSICYDLRFPELYRALAERGACIVTVPAAFAMKTGKDHWETLLRARGIENQVFILASAQIGNKPDGSACYGRSMIIDPWGTVLARAQDSETIIMADLDMDHLAHIRRTLPVLNNRRL